MSIFGDFSELGLDQIREIAAADNDHASGIDEQAAAAIRLADMVAEAVAELGRGFQKINQPSLLQGTDDLIAAAEHSGSIGGSVGQVFQGESARVAITQLTELTQTGADGVETIVTQPETLLGLAEAVRRTNREIADLHRRRQRHLDLASTDPTHPELQEIPGVGPFMSPESMKLAINEEYDQQARDTMQTSVDGYYEQASTLATPRPYTGPRVPTPTPTSSSTSTGYGDDGNGDVPEPDGGSGSHRFGGDGHFAPGPQLSSTNPTATGSPPPIPHGTGPELTGPGQSAPTVSVTNLPGPNPPAPPSTSVFGPITSGGHFVPNQSVTRPVFGGRTTPNFSATRQPLRPNTSGTVRPVFGERPGKATNAFGRPQQPVVRPGTAKGHTASRGDRPGVRALPSRSITADPGRTGRTQSPRPLTGSRRAAEIPSGDRRGARTQPPRAHTADGRVIRSRTPSLPTPQVKRAEFGRSPQTTHGGNEKRDRAALRNSRALSAPPKPREAAATGDDPAPLVETTRKAVAEDWYDDSAVVPPVIRGAREATEPVNHDPGHYVTRHNLGNRL